MILRILPVLFALALAACAPAPDPARPALWQVTAPDGKQGWLFGTIHALPRPALWRGAAVDRALRDSFELVVEVADLGNDRATGEAYAALSQSPGLPALAQRLDPALRPQLAEVLGKAGLSEGQFAKVETWAVALTLARALAPEQNARYGIDRAVLDAASDKRVLELEGAAKQFALFDALPEVEQRDFLSIVVREGGDAGESDLAQAWRQGDMTTIEKATRLGILADAELREALFTARNRAWTDKVAAMIVGGNQPFVAVGAAHMVGEDGLVAMLQARGFKVERVQ